MKNVIYEILPENFLARLASVVDPSHLNKVLDSFTQNRPTTFRANTLKISASDLEKELTLLGFELEKVSWFADAFILVFPAQKELMETKWYTDGFLYIQSLSSMIPPIILNPLPHESVCDLTAAPGSKTTQMAAMMENSGTIVANDKSNIRNFKLAANLRIQGANNVKITQLPGQIFWMGYKEKFDKTLIDVPCSMEGRFNSSEPKTFADWSMHKIRYLVKVQRFLLRSAISCTKPGGTIVYSTCTLAPEENEGIINWILKKEAGTVEVEHVKLKYEEITEPLKKWNDKQFSEQVAKTIRILPSKLMEGFYIAKLRKVRSNLV